MREQEFATKMRAVIETGSCSDEAFRRVKSAPDSGREEDEVTDGKEVGLTPRPECWRGWLFT